jgi:hypothetical protein
MKNIHILKTDKPTSLFIIEGKLYNYHKPQQCDGVDKINVNIYITSDEEIKEGDWLLNLNGIFKVKPNYINCNPTYKKIILTTDTDLIKDGVQAIDDEFLEWFVKNQSCESVEVEEIHYSDTNRYEIIIPTEEFCTCNTDEEIRCCTKVKDIFGCELQEESKQDWYCPKCQSYVSSENVTFEETHQICNTGVIIEKTKQETLEEVADRLTKDFPHYSVRDIMDDTDIKGWLLESLQKGAKWQKEKTIEEVFEWLTTNNYLTDLKETLIENFKKR